MINADVKLEHEPTPRRFRQSRNSHDVKIRG